MKAVLIWAILSIALLWSCKDERSVLGDQYFAQGKYQKAIDAYTEYLRLEPFDIKSIYNRGRAYEELGKFDKAMDDFNRVLGEDPMNTNALLSIGNFHYREGRGDEQILSVKA